MMQSAEYGCFDNSPFGLDRAMHGRVLIQRHVRAADVVIVVNVVGQDCPKVIFVQNDDMIQAFSPKCAIHAFRDRILPWRMRSRWGVFKTKTLDMAFEVFTEDFVVIPNDVFCGFIKSESFPKLLDDPLRMRPGTDAKV